MTGLSFQKRLLLGVLLLVLTTTATLAFVGIFFGSDFLRIRFEDRMNFLSRYLALNAELGILLGDQTMLEQLAENLLSESDVTMVWIEDARGDVLVKTGSDTKKLRGESVSPVWLNEQKDDLVFGRHLSQKQLLGKVHVIYTTAGINTLLTDLRNLYLFAGLGLGGAGLLIFFFFSRSLVAPLKELAAAAREVASGNLDIRVNEGSIPETKQLAGAFNNMLASLAESRVKLEETYRQITQQKALAEVGHFALTVAHEIKNPLGIMRGALDVLKKNEIDGETKSTMISYMEEEIYRLNRLIQDFLKFSRPQKPNFRNVDLNALLKNLVERSKLEWQQKGVAINDKVPGEKCESQADEDLISQAILNVLKNGCEACDGNGTVTISANCVEKNWTLILSDTGKGVPQEAREKAFDPFFTTKSQGSGLGLAFVDQVVKAHGGEVTLGDNKNGGALVSLKIPLTQIANKN
ncbi:MAG: HAMP domain-containing histidine kinase [Desulfobulbaceae bacterium]|nr:HAMP domain-containing histidine kinase [Desulfobulbaceae bacterium]